MPTLPTVPFLDLSLASCTASEFVAWIVDSSRRPEVPIRVGYLNAAQINRAFDEDGFGDLLRQMDCLYADGQSVVWATKLKRNRIPERVNAGDFLEEFLESCARSDVSLALVGSTADNVGDFARDCARKYPNLRIVYRRDGYFGEEESESVREEIERHEPDIVLLGSGAPSQETHALRWSSPGRPRVWWCVGGLFEYGPGRRRRAPKWLRRAGLEWLFRLALEPRRLAMRYIYGNPKFILRVLMNRSVP